MHNQIKFELEIEINKKAFKSSLAAFALAFEWSIFSHSLRVLGKWENLRGN